MYRIKYLLVAFLLLSLTACTVSTPAPEKKLLFSQGDVAGYVTIRNDYVEGDILIAYPSVRGLSDGELQDSINDLIKQKALEVAATKDEKGYGTLRVRLDYDIMMNNNNILSIKYYGYLDRPHVALHPTNLSFATNIDLTTGKLITLEDLFTVNLFENYDRSVFRYIYPYDPQRDSEDTLAYWAAHASSAEIRKIFQGHAKYYIHDDDFYFTNGYLGVFVTVAHVMGDRLEFVANYADLQQWMNMDNPIWQQLK